ncbi:MAG: MmyB family transcriptional regulator [Vulcanimicrobiaceae bacterium]
MSSLCARRPCGDAPVAEVAESVTDAQRRVLDALDPNPAYIIGRRWDVLAQNNATSAVLGDYASASGYGCNMLWRFFMERSQREFVSDWDRLARTLVAKFRAVAAHYSADPAFGALVGELLETSSEFRKLWAQHDVVRILGGLKVYNHPVVGELMLEYTTLMVPDFPDMRMMVYTPARGSESEHKLRDLVASYGKLAVLA